MKRRRKKRPAQNEQSLLRALTRKAYFAQHGRCKHCGDPMPLNEATGDHYPIPRYQGGQTKAGNIVAACVECNTTAHKNTDRKGGKYNMTCGDDTPRSPFEVLARLYENLSQSYK